MDTPETDHEIETTPRVTPPAKYQSAQTNNSTRLILSIVGVLVLAFGAFILLLTFSNSSKPTDALYDFKTNVAETFIRATKVSVDAKIAYDTMLLERRVVELNELSQDTSTSTEETVVNIARLFESRVTTVVATLDQDQNMTGEERIITLAHINTLARAQETIADSSAEFDAITDTLAATENSVNEALDAAINTFVDTNATDTIQQFIGTQISVISSEVVSVAAGSNAQNQVIRRISDTNEAIIDGEFVDAITYILKARQAIATDQYLYDSERGPIDGIQIEPGPIPEGS